MAAQRILGQNVSIVIIKDSVPLQELNCIKSFSFTFELEMKDEGYLGETTNRKDSVFKGVKFDMELHTNNKRIFEFVKDAIDTARRRTPGIRINIKASLTYPNGDLARITFPDCEFGDFPFSIGSRTDYVNVKIDGACSEANVVLT